MQSERKHSRDRLPEEINIGISRAIGRPRTVLDVGCGLGLNGAVAKLVGATVVGIESDVANAARARRLLDEVLELDVLVTGADGEYATFVQGVDGKLARYRLDDGVHLAPAGARVVASWIADWVRERR